MPVRECHFRARPNRDAKDMFGGEMASIEGSEHVFIGKVITEAHRELGRLASLSAVGFDEAFDNFSFVDECRTDFEICFAGHDFDVPCLANSLLKLFLALTRIVST